METNLKNFIAVLITAMFLVSCGGGGGGSVSVGVPVDDNPPVDPPVIGGVELDPEVIATTTVVVSVDTPEPVDCEYTFQDNWVDHPSDSTMEIRYPVVSVPSAHGGMPCPLPETRVKVVPEPVDCEYTFLDNWVDHPTDPTKEIRYPDITRDSAHGGESCPLSETRAKVVVDPPTVTTTVSMPDPVDCEYTFEGVEWVDDPDDPTKEIRYPKVSMPSAHGGESCPLSETRIKAVPVDCEYTFQDHWEDHPSDSTLQIRYPDVNTPSENGGKACPLPETRAREEHNFVCGIVGTQFYGRNAKPGVIYYIGGWCGQGEFRAELNSQIAAGSVTVVNDRIVLADPEFETSTHGVDIFHYLRRFHSGGSIVTMQAYNPGQIDTAVEKGQIKEGSIISWSSDGHYSDDHHATFTPSVYIDRKIAVVVAAGNDGNDEVPTDTNLKNPAFKEALDSGYFVWVVGLRADGIGLVTNSQSCGATMHQCIAAYFTVWDFRTNKCCLRGTSFSVPSVVAAIDLLRTRWPNLDNKMAISVMLETARDICAPGVDPLCGRGALDFTAMFSPYGELTVSYDAPSTSTREFRRGDIQLPGLNDKVSAKGHDYFGRDFSLVLNQHSIRPKMEFVDTNFTNTTSNWKASRDAISYCKKACVFLSKEKEIGMSFKDVAYVSLQKSDDFFGGYGTNSLSFGDTVYGKAGLKKSLHFNNLAVKFGLDIAKGIAGDGEHVKDIKGILMYPSISLEKKTTRSRLSFGLGYSLFNGDAEIVGESYRLRGKDTEINLLWEFRI